MEMNLNLDVLKSIVNANFEVITDRSNTDYGVVNIRFNRDLKESEVRELSDKWVKRVDIDGEELVVCWGGGNVLGDNEIGINYKVDEMMSLDFDDDEGYCGYYDFDEYWEDVKGNIVGLDRYEENITIY